VSLLIYCGAFGLISFAVVAAFADAAAVCCNCSWYYWCIGRCNFINCSRFQSAAVKL